MNPIAKTLDQHKQANRSIQATVGKMADIYRDARERLNAKLQKHVLSGRDPLEGKQLVKLIEDLSNAYGKLEEAFRKEFDRAIPYVAEGYYFDALKDLGKTVLGKPDTAKIDLMKRDAFAHVAGMTQNMLKTDVAFIRQASAEVFRVASATGITREEATQALLAKILGRPEGFKFVDAGGRTWSNQAYCEMLSRTVLLNAGRQTYFDTCAENGEDVVRVTVSGNPCPACAVWENRLLSISGATKGLPTVEQATAAGLCHPNCTHSFVAVGEFARSEDFTGDGRPKTGVNSPGKEEKNDPEAWKKYRQGPAKPAAKPAAKTAKPKPAKPAAKPSTKPAPAAEPSKPPEPPPAEQPELPLEPPEPSPAVRKETPEEHRARRQAQWEAAYDKRRDAWHQSIIDAGGSKEVAGELADAYTPEMAKLGKPPKIVFGKDGAYHDPWQNEIHLESDASSWGGHPLTARHEFGHWVDFHTRFRNHRKFSTLEEVRAAAAEFNAAAEADWKLLKQKARGNLIIYKEKLNAASDEPPKGSYWEELSQTMFGKQKGDLNLPERKILRQHMDALGSITNGKYGGGHSPGYYRGQWGNEEAFAQAYAAYCRNDKQFQLEFPNITAYIENLMKGLEK